MMPYIDGFEAIKILKEKEATRGLPVIMLTAKRHDADLIHGLEAGAVSYLTKPFAPQELITIVERILAEKS
jgi:DNA-binding response OmpR family regulator